MIRALSAVLLLIVLAACSSVPSTQTAMPSAIPPTLTPEPLPTLPILAADALQLKPNEYYGVLITFGDSPPARVTIYEPYPSDKTVSFDLVQKDTENPELLAADKKGTDWRLPYILYAVNMQPNRDTPSSQSIGAGMVLSPDARTLAFTLCNESGGRGQWCGDTRLWFFDLATGSARLANFSNYAVLYIKDKRFSDDSRYFSGFSCLKYDNPYFGYCGSGIDMGWDVSDGQLTDQITPVPSATP